MRKYFFVGLIISIVVGAFVFGIKTVLPNQIQPAHAQSSYQQPLNLYTPTPQPYSWTVNGTTYSSKNPYAAVYGCQTPGNDGGAKVTRDICVPNGWNSGTVPEEGNKSCKDLRISFDGPDNPSAYCSSNSSVNGSPFFTFNPQPFTYNQALMCPVDGSNSIILAGREDITACSVNDPQCSFYVDNVVTLKACKSDGSCSSYDVKSDDTSGTPLPFSENLCGKGLFTTDGIYTVSAQGFDRGGIMYGASNIWLTFKNYSSANAVPWMQALDGDVHSEGAITMPYAPPGW